MPARAGSSYTIPGRGTVVRAKSGKAKSFAGRGPAPAGTKKVKPKTAATAPTLTVAGGDVSTANFSSPAAATAAKGRQRSGSRRVRRIVRRAAAAERIRHAAPEALSSTQPAVPLLSDHPEVFGGRKTAGTPTRAELNKAAIEGTLKANKAGFETTPKVRKAAMALKKAKAVVRKTEPNAPGLSPQERAVLPLVRRAHREHPDVPKSVMMAQIKQESGFNAAAVSSAGAQGLTQFIPSTAAEYGVEYGTSRKAQQSQVSGEAKLLHADDFARDPQGALSAYSGGYSAGAYNDPILRDARSSYGSLDKRGNPKARKRLVRAKAQAAAVGLKAVVSQAPGPAPKKVVTRFKAIKSAAKELESKGFPYSWGGGHDASFAPGGEGENGGPGYDCSGAVSFVLHKAGVLSSPLTSGSMGSVLAPGPGAVTVFYNAGHTFMRIGNQYWGTSVGDAGAGGIGKHPAPSASYLAQYSVGHVPGLGRKQALQLGIPMGPSTGSAVLPGMTLSPAGTTATIDSGAGVTKSGKAGFSGKPIRATPFQKAMRSVREAKALGSKVHVPGEAVAAEEAPVDTQLSALERKYGKAAV